MRWYDELAEDEVPAAPRFAAGPGTDEFVEDSEDGLAAAGFGAAEEPVEWTPEQGFSDPLNVVRVWPDPAGGLARVRFSLSWRSRLAGRPLGESVTVAFMLMNNYLHAYTSPVFDEELPVVTRAPSAERVAKINQRWAEIDAELAELDPAEFPGYREVWEPAMGTDCGNGVGVWLDRSGRAAVARFNDGWLRTTNGRALAGGVMSSYRRARAGYRRPVRALDRRGELLAERHRLMHELSGPPRPVVGRLSDDLVLPAPPGVFGRG